MPRTNNGVTHELKCFPVYFEAIKNSSKKFEIRKNDRDFMVGDLIKLMEWDASTSEYTGRHLIVGITYILDHFVGIQAGFCVLSIDKI